MKRIFKISVAMFIAYVVMNAIVTIITECDIIDFIVSFVVMCTIVGCVCAVSMFALKMRNEE